MTVLASNPVEINIGLRSNGCGHSILLSREHYDACLENGRAWYCSVCGVRRVFTGESEIQKIRRERDAAIQREETRKQMCRNLEESLAKEKRSKALLKKRVKNGVCPCCTRSFQNLKRHIATKHPDFAE